MGNNNNLSNTKKQFNRLNDKQVSSSIDSIIDHPFSPRLSIRFKFILTAIAISIIPASLLSIVTYSFTKNLANREIIQAQEQVVQIQVLRTQNLAEQFRQFLQIRYQEVESLTKNQIFTNPNLWKKATLEQKKAILTSFQAKNKFYNEITFLDIQGSPLFQSQSSESLDSNYSNHQYFQEAIASKKIIVNRAESKHHRLGIEYLAPIVNIWTGKVDGLIYIFLSEQAMKDIFIHYTDNNQEWYLIDSEGILFAGSNEQYINSNAEKFFPEIDNLYRARKNNTGLYFNQSKDDHYLLSYVPVIAQGLYPDKYLGVVISTEIFPAVIEMENGELILLLIVIITAIIIGTIAAYIVNNMTIPLLNSIKAVERISQGKLDTRIPIRGKDELAVLGNKINQMAEKLMYLIERQTMLTKTSELMARIARARNIQQLQSPFNRFLTEVRSLIKSDRLIFYQFDQNWSGTIIAESVAQGFLPSLGSEINDPCFIKEYIDKYKRGRIQATRNIYEAGLTECHLQQLEEFAVKSNLVIPVVIKIETESESESERDELIGLLIAHQCSNIRIWNNFEIDYLKEVASQLGLALRGYGICRQVLEQQEIFQRQVKYLIHNNQKLSCGNLKICASTSSHELNDLTKFLKSVIQGIAELIVPIKTNIQVIQTNLKHNRDIVTELNQQVVEQKNQIEQIITTIEPIANQGQIIYKNINEINKISHGVITQISVEKTNFAHVFETVAKLQTTVLQSIEKIKNIEQSSIEIIGTVPIIQKISLQTELLAQEIEGENSAAIDPSSKKMQKIALQLRTVIADIEAIGENIQQQTSGMVRSMEIDSAQTSALTPLVASSNKNMAKISKTSVEIDHLLQLTNSSTISQITALQKITNLTTKLTQLSERSSHQSHQAKNSNEVIEIAIQRLQKSVDVFKLEK